MHDALPSMWAGLSAGVAAWIAALASGARFDWRRDRGGMAIMHIEAPNRRLEVVATQAISHFEIQGVDKYKFSECLPVHNLCFVKICGLDNWTRTTTVQDIQRTGKFSQVAAA
jgi:hypothetical protein